MRGCHHAGMIPSGATYALIAFTLACAVSAFLLYFGRILALRAGFADHPGGRKRHKHPVPPIGGLVIIPVFVLATTLFMPGAVPFALPAGLLLLMAMGAADDAFHIRPVIRFSVQVLVAVCVVAFGGANIASFGDLFGAGPVWTGVAGPIFAVCCLVLLMNAINMMDGMDGLSAGFCLLVAVFLAGLCAASGRWADAAVLSVLSGGLVAFLGFNLRAPWRERASVFLGDSGSLALGLLIGWYAITLSQPPGAVIEPASIPWILTIPVMDVFALFFIRMARGRHPFEADRNHLHHRVMARGFPPSKATPVILFAGAVCIAAGYAGAESGVPQWVLLALWAVMLCAHAVFGLKEARGSEQSGNPPQNVVG